MSVSRHTGYNILGTIAPVLVALVSIPIYIDLIGEQRYGVLSIAWILLGYFGVFDLGIGRAAAQRIASLNDDQASKNRCFWTALSLNSSLGILGGIAIWPAAYYFFSQQFQIDAKLQPEMLRALAWLIIALPIATINGVLTGSLQGVERFLQLNVVNATGSVLFQTLPVLVAWLWSPSLDVLLPVAIGARLVNVIFLLLFCLRNVTHGSVPSISVSEARALLKFGGWITVSSLISPIMVMADRFIVGAILGASAVTHYSVPFQLAERSTIIPGALSSSLFPRFAKESVHSGQKMAVNAIRHLVVIMTPLMVAAILLAHPFLALWISTDFSNRSALVLQILLIGFWANGLARIPHAKLQATGQPKVVAICHLAEIIPYLALLFIGMHLGGVAGAALALSLRIFADYVLLSAQANTLLPTGALSLSGLAPLIAALLLTRQNFPNPVIALTGIGLVTLTTFWAVMQAPDTLKQRALRLFVRS